MADKEYAQQQKASGVSVRRALYCTIIIVVTVAAFSPSLQNGFTNWDDDLYVTKNQSIQGFSLNHLEKQFSSAIGYYQPVTMITYMIDFCVYGLHPAGYHATNLLFHILNSLIVFALIIVLSKNELVGFLTALFFAVHPLRVESVAWIAERKDVVSSFFFFSALWFYVNFWEKKQWRWYCGCLALFALSLLSKPMAVTLPLILLLIDYQNGRKLNARAVVEKWPFFVTAALFSLAAYITQSHYGALATQLNAPILQRVALPFFGIFFYLYKSFIPLHLCVFYPGNYGGFSAHPLVYPILATAVGAAAFFLGRKYNKVVFGLLFYCVTLLPVLQIVPIGGFIAAERYTYVPMIGIYYLIALGSEQLLRKMEQQHRALRSVVIAGLCSIIFVLAFLTFERCKVWKDSVSLWSDAISVHPSPLAYNNLGLGLAMTGRTTEAIPEFRKALEMDPEDAGNHTNFADVLIKSGRVDEAIFHYRIATNLESKNAEAHANLAAALMQIGNTPEGYAEFRRALELNPDNALIHNNLANALLRAGRVDEAISHYRTATDLDSGNAEAQGNLATALVRAGKTGEAFAHYRAALKINPEYADGLYNFSMVLLQNGYSEQAIINLRTLVKIDPDRPGIHKYLGEALLQDGAAEEAVSHLRLALKAYPNDEESAHALGRAYLAIGRPDEAIDCLRHASELAPADMSILNDLSQALLQSGHVDSAVSTARRALKLARSAGNGPLAKEIEQNIDELVREPSPKSRDGSP